MNRKKRIAILHPSYAGTSSPFKDVDMDCDPSLYLTGPDYTNFQIAKATAVRQVIEVAGMGFDFVINLCDGVADEDRAGIEVVQELERSGAAFTGVRSSFYNPSREEMKIAGRRVGVPFPAYAQARSIAGVDQALNRLRFPMIVKHPNGYGSLGMTRDSRVTDAEALQREVFRIVESYGAALIEEFIEGREFSVLVTEPRNANEDAWALQPIEFLYPAGESFNHFDMKWAVIEGLETRMVTDDALASRMRKLSALLFVALGGSGYGRCDLRVDVNGEIYMLEINPNCGIFYPDLTDSADIIIANDPGGHAGFLDHLFTCAERWQKRTASRKTGGR